MGTAKTITWVPVPDLCCLWAETPAAPMNIALIGIFDGAILTGPGGQVELAAIRSFIAAHPARGPMLRRALLPTRPGQSRMAWIDAPHFDIGDHVILTVPGRPFTGEGDFLDWCARRPAIPLDHTRPLWRMDVIPGLPGGRVGVLMVVHHVAADGLRAVATIAALLDPAPDGHDAPAPRWRPELPPTARELMTGNLRTRVRAIGRGRPAHPPQGFRALRAVIREQARHAPPTPLTGPVGAGRQLLVLRQPLEDLRTRAHANECIVNDLLLAAVTTGLRAMLREQGACPEGLALVTLAYIGALAASVQAFGGGPGFIVIGAVYLGAAAVAAAAPTPGGLGAIEAALVAGLTGVGMAAGPAVSAVPLYRLATYWLPVAPGWLCWRVLQRREYL